MNHLNSVLIEGVLILDPVMVEKDSRNVCTFELVSTGYYNRDGERYKEDSFYDIEVKGKSDIEKCKGLTVGRGVRAVGRMMVSLWYSVPSTFTTRWCETRCGARCEAGWCEAGWESR